MKLNNGIKLLLVGICLIVSIIGFMVKLPFSFRHIDKELHTAFYFLAAAFLNFLFANKKLIRHILIFAVLYLFGMAIEYAQAYSNKFFHKKIHGRYDVEDIQSNLKGLIAFSVLWLIYHTVLLAYNQSKPKRDEADKTIITSENID